MTQEQQDFLAPRLTAPLSNALFQGTVAQLPAGGVVAGTMAWATNGRKTGELAGAGTGVLVYADTIAGTVTWKRISDDVTAVA